jgi:RHS repeat-associated protein
MSRWTQSLIGRCLALLQIALLLSAGCTSDSLAPTPGSAEYLAPGMIPVPGAVVNAAGGNLLVERTDLTLDSLVGGTLAVGAVYNSSLAGWTFSFAMRWSGGAFTDGSGRSFDATGLADGAAIPGTHWVKVDADTVQTKGGLAHDFDALGRLAVMRWATLDYPRIRYTWGAGALEIAQCTTAASCTAFYSIAFDASQRPITIADVRGGRRAELTWDASGHLAVAKSPLEVEKHWPGTRYEYGLLGTLTAITNSEGERVEYAYQSGDRIQSVTQIGEGNPTHRFAFYAPGPDRSYETLYTNPLGARTRLYFDSEYRLQELEFVETGERRSYRWAGLRPATVTLESGATTRFGYQGDDPVAITDAAGNAIQITYQPGGLDRESPRTRAIARIEDSLGLVEERSYDGSGRVVGISNGAGESVGLTYHATSLVASLTQPTGSTLAFPLYGQHGHWLESDGVAPDKRSFDTTGNPKVETAKGRRGGELSREFDANRWLAALDVAATDATGVTASGLITIERRSDGQPLAIRRPYGGDHEFGYDALGRLVEQRERVDGQWQTTFFEPDLAGNTTARSRPNGMREEWQYDGYGRVVRYRALKNGALEGEAVYGYQNGLLASAFDSIRGSSEQYGYDAAGRLVLTSFGYGEIRSLEYDLRSRVTAEVFAIPGQVLFDVGYQHDPADRLIRTFDRGTQQTLVEHAIEAGRIRETRYGNGLVRAYAYDAAGLIAGAQTRGAAGELVEATAIERTGETNPVRLQVRSATTTPLASTDEQYWLDAGEKLSDPGKRVFGYRSGSGTPRYYAYDELSNQIGASGGASYGYNEERNRLLAAGPLSYGYDEAGFATSRGGVPITWSATGRLAGYGSTSATWDLSGRLVELALGGVTRRFDLFGGRIESDASSGAIGALDLGEVSLAPLSGDRTYRHFDFRGNVSFVSNDAGEVTNHHRYGPYGAEQTFGTGTNANTFVGKPEAGPFQLLGARVYDPGIGRFLSADPMLTATNSYAYTSGNPVLFMDQSGLFEVKASHIAFGFGVVAVAAGIVATLPVSATVMIGAASLAEMAALTGAFARLGAFYFSSLSLVFGSDFPADAGGSSAGGGGGGGGGGSGGGGGGGGKVQFRNVVFQAAGQSLSLVYTPATPSSCSPSTFDRIGGGERFVWILLAVNTLLGVAWYRRRNSGRRLGRAGESMKEV